jgi:hypothetical protein
MHKILALGQVLYLPLLGIQPGIIEMERHIGSGVFIQSKVNTSMYCLLK